MPRAHIDDKRGGNLALDAADALADMPGKRCACIFNGGEEPRGNSGRGRSLHQIRPAQEKLLAPMPVEIAFERETIAVGAHRAAWWP
jgi:hypothetical protein